MSFESECKDKVRYLTRRLGRKALRQVKDRYGGHLNVYPCSHCPFFHIGHYNPGSRALARARRTAS